MNYPFDENDPVYNARRDRVFEAVKIYGPVANKNLLLEGDTSTQDPDLLEDVDIVGPSGVVLTVNGQLAKQLIRDHNCRKVEPEQRPDVASAHSHAEGMAGGPRSHRALSLIHI